MSVPARAASHSGFDGGELSVARLTLLVVAHEFCGRPSMYEPVRHVGCWQRFAPQKPLCERAAETLEYLELIDGFDAFGDDVETHCLTQHGDGMDEWPVIIVGAEVCDEGAVDFDDVDGGVASDRSARSTRFRSRRSRGGFQGL